MPDANPASPPARRVRWLQMASVVYGIPFVWVGIQHFIRPEIFEPIVPPWLGWPWFWVHITGYTEIALGIGVMVPRTRRIAGWLMVLQLLLLYLANLHMWMADIPFQGVRMGTAGHIIRLAIRPCSSASRGARPLCWPDRFEDGHRDMIHRLKTTCSTRIAMPGSSFHLRDAGEPPPAASEH